MKNKHLLLIASLCGVCLVTSGCTTCPTQHHMKHGQHEQHNQMRDQKHNKHQYKHQQQPQQSETVVFYQNYAPSDIHNVTATMETKSNQGGTAEMGTIQFIETDDGLKMNVDLMYLRPNTNYTAQIFQCGACNDTTCCAVTAMNIDLPQLMAETDNRLQQSYIIRGLTAAQLNNAQLILTRDGGYKAAWGMLKQ